MNRRKVRFVGKQPETLETIFNAEGQEGTGTKKKKELTQEKWKTRRKQLK